MGNLIGYLKYWLCRPGKWYEGPVMLFVSLYAYIGFAMIALNGFFHFLPKWGIWLHFLILGLGVIYSGVMAHRAHRGLEEARLQCVISKKALDESLIEFLDKVAPILNFTERPGVEELSKVAQVAYIIRTAKLSTHQSELQLVESWVRYWDEEKVK